MKLMQQLSYGKLARLWIVFSVASLLLSGALALVITFAKMPYIKTYVENLDLIRWCLVIHVNLATLVWFTSFPLGLTFFVSKEEDQPSFTQYLGLAIATLGVILFVTALPFPGIQVIMSNYIPVIQSSRFFIGIALYVMGVLLSYLSPSLVKGLFLKSTSTPYTQVGFGILLGASFYIVSVITFIFSLYQLLNKNLPFDTFFFEKLMWGAGHVLQHSSAVFALICWTLLFSLVLGRNLLQRKELFLIFAWLSVPLFIIPFLFLLSPIDSSYRRGFTTLMQWGLAPPLLYFVIKAFRRISVTPSSFADYRFCGAVLSIILMIFGFIFGAFIRGSDLRIPGHYHAAIGSTTLVFMVMSFYLLSKRETDRWMLRTVITFFTGQFLFSGAMFLAGCLGVSRKTYGAEHAIEGFWLNFSFIVMAIGGVTAFIGGILFAVAVIPHLRFEKLLTIFKRSSVQRIIDKEI